MQSRDQVALTYLFPDRDEGYFEDLYFEQLQNNHVVFVASHKPNEGERQYFGFGQVQWSSHYTHFWRYNTAEIIALQIAQASDDLIADLLTACESAAREAGNNYIGVALIDAPSTPYENNGYTEATQEGDTVLWWKKL